jgi:nucleotide-binding universal stress UspA family protein
MYAMYRKVLVPLDTSVLAESVLSHVKNLGKGDFVGEVTVLIVLTPYFPLPEGGDFSTYCDSNATRERIRDESIKYLANVESRLVSEGIKVRTELLMGSRPAEIISDYARNNGIDLIIISTHGYTGLKKLMLGSVALEVLHNCHAPVLLIRPESCRI